MDLRQKIIFTFEHFYNKVYKGSNFKLDLSKNKQERVLENFLTLLAQNFQIDGININFIVFYISFGFSKFASQKLNRPIAFSWVIGKKMFTRFLNRKEEETYYVNRFLNEYDINIDQLRSQLIEKEDKQVLDKAEELEKIRFHGDARLYNCLQNTTLYNHRSVNCLTCEQKSVCKRLLKETYPKIFIKRGYETK